MNQLHTSRRLSVLAQALFCCATALIYANAGFGQGVGKQPDATTLPRNQSLEYQIRGGETHLFSFTLKKEQYARVEVENKKLDVVVSLLGADGKLLVEMDGRNGHLWREIVSALTGKAGASFLVKVKAYGLGEQVGSYSIKLAELRAVEKTDGLRLEAEQHFYQARKLYLRGKPDYEGAVREFESSLRIWREIGDKRWQALTLVNLGWTFNDLSQDEKAINSHTEASKLFQEVKDRVGEGKAANGLGTVYIRLKQYEKARGLYEQALAIRRELGDRRSESVTLYYIGKTYAYSREYEKALPFYEQSLNINRELKDRAGEGLLLNDLGYAFINLNKYEAGIKYFEDALAIERELKDRAFELSILRALGVFSFALLHQNEKARDYLEKALEIEREIKDPAGETEILIYLGTVYRRLSQLEKAQSYLDIALEITKKRQDKAAQSNVLKEIASLYLSLGNCDRAREILLQALALKRELGNDKAGESSVLKTLSTAHVCQGEDEKVIEYSEQALKLDIELKDKFGQASLLTTLGGSYSNMGQHEKAQAYYERSLKLSRDAGLKYFQALTLSQMANNYKFYQQYEKALALYEESLTIVRELKDPDFFRSILRGIADVRAELRQYDAAREYYEQSLKIAEGINNANGQADDLHSLGLLYARLRQSDKARDYLERALKIARANKNVFKELYLLTSIGRLLDNTTLYEEALKYHWQALELARGVKNLYWVASQLKSLGLTYTNLNQFDEARNYLVQALAIARETKNGVSEALSLLALGNIYFKLSQYEKARESYERGLKLAQEIKHKGLIGISTVGVGAVYADLSQNQVARDNYEQSLALMKETFDRRGEGNVLNAMAAVYLNLKQYDKARTYSEQALAIAREVKEKRGEAEALINLGAAYSNLNQYEKARGFYEQGLALAIEVRDRANEDYALIGLGDVYRKSNQFEKADEFYQRALVLAREIKSKKLEGSTLSSLMELLNKQKDRRFAVFYGKQAVNTFQEIRANLKSFDRDSQQTYLRDKEETYRTLAGILVSLGRIPEAEQVLAMLKEAELFEYLRRNDSVAKELLKAIPPNDLEREAIKRYEEFAERITAIGAQVSGLQKARSSYPEGEFPEQAKLDDLQQRLDDASKAFKKFLVSLKKTFGQENVRVAQVDSGLRAKLQRLQADHAVIVSTIVGKERLNIIVTTTQTQRAHIVEITEEALNELIQEFHLALVNPRLDPRPAGQKLYDILVKPLEADLAGVKADTIVWSLDRALRYIPPAALWDKERGYLAERFANNIITLASTDALAIPVSDKNNWRGLGVGVSKGSDGFSALPAVPDELNCVISEPAGKDGSSAGAACVSGVVPGRRLLDEAFTQSAFVNSLGSYQIIHIASHFKFLPGNDRDSFLLLGGGAQRRLTVEQLSSLSLTTPELITLSACNTATPGGEQANGIEVESFGAVAQKIGARSVVATLWSVADPSTRDFMIKFYQFYVKGGMSKTEALRQAQLALLNGARPDAPAPVQVKVLTDAAAQNDLLPPKAESGGAQSRDTSEVTVATQRRLLPYVKDAGRPYAHPYYWAPFVLFGNWR